MPVAAFGLIIFYAVGVLVLLWWLVNATESVWLKSLVAALYLGIPGCNHLAQEARYKDMRGMAEQAEDKRRNDKAESEAAFVRFCEENLKSDNPLPKCRPFRSLGPDEEQLSIQ